MRVSVKVTHTYVTTKEIKLNRKLFVYERSTEQRQRKMDPSYLCQRLLNAYLQILHDKRKIRSRKAEIFARYESEWFPVERNIGYGLPSSARWRFALVNENST